MSAGEATVKGCGVAVAMPQGQSWAPTSTSESQWTREPFRSACRARPARGWGLGPLSAERPGRGGAAV